MSKFELFLSLHLLAAIVWIGSNVMVEAMVSRARAAGDGAHLTGVLADWAWMGSRVFPAAAVVMLVTGLLMVGDVEGYELGDPWISVGMGVLVVLILLGAGYTGPRAAKLVESIRTDGYEAGATQAALTGVRTAARVELGLFTLVVVDMAVKPGL